MTAWKLLSREPTREMYDAAEREWDGRMSARAAGVWYAMFDAAPEQPLINIEEIRGAVARGWCSPQNSHKEMDGDLALAIADEIFKLLAPERTESEAAIEQRERT